MYHFFGHPLKIEIKNPFLLWYPYYSVVSDVHVPVQVANDYCFDLSKSIRNLVLRKTHDAFRKDHSSCVHRASPFVLRSSFPSVRVRSAFTHH